MMQVILYIYILLQIFTELEFFKLFMCLVTYGSLLNNYLHDYKFSIQVGTYLKVHVKLLAIKYGSPDFKLLINSFSNVRSTWIVLNPDKSIMQNLGFFTDVILSVPSAHCPTRMTLIAL